MVGRLLRGEDLVVSRKKPWWPGFVFQVSVGLLSAALHPSDDRSDVDLVVGIVFVGDSTTRRDDGFELDLLLYGF